MILWGKTEPRPAYLKEKLRVESAHDLRARLITRCRAVSVPLRFPLPPTSGNGC